jgi:serine/threonine protein kinase
VRPRLTDRRRDIIHGDIKPINILVFKNQNDGYTAKVADLGYATLATNNDLVQVATSEPWTDPNYRGERLDLSTAKKLDSYSFGLVCVWLLKQTSSMRSPFSSDTAKDASFNLVERIAHCHNLDERMKLIGHISDLDCQQQLNLEGLFRLCLEGGREHRSSNFQHFLELLGESRSGNLRENFWGRN